MPRMTSAELAAYEARRAPVDQRSGSAPGTELDLHSKIFDECRRRGWIALHGSMSERTHRTLGEWDFTVLADGGRVFFVECKSRDGKLRPEQLAMIVWAQKLGHTVRIIRSIEEFLNLIKELR